MGDPPAERVERMFKLVAGIAAFVLLAGTAGANAASGTAMGVDPAAEARLRGDTRTLVVGADVFIGDRIVTGPSGQVQILFDDRTELVVGPRSALVIEDYLLRDNGSAGRLAINALSGTFRFVTGTAPKDRYLITTPAGTIGVRGTSLDLYVAQAIHYLLQHHGATINCPLGVPIGHPSCVVADDECEYVVVQSSGAELVGHTDEITGEERERLKGWFPYSAGEQRNLLRQFRISNAERCFRRAAPAGGGGSLIDLPPRRNRDSTSDSGIDNLR